MPSEVDTALHDASICPRASGNAAPRKHPSSVSPHDAMVVASPPQEGVLGDFRATHVSHVRRRAGRPPVVHGQSLSSWMRCMRRSWAVDHPSSHLVSRSSVAPE
ncbi:hypothetical protein SESBI_15958 [Sesbania bispinosa]|nr:hypothetical protein SESBI_15958 [Sesbania bispinosa]